MKEMSTAMPQKLFGWTCAVILIVMLVNVWHPFLWGPDEPREAEIARETLLSGNYVTPHFNQIPFVEKPPLYYDLTALAFRLCGGKTDRGFLHPGAARMVSALLGVLMLIALLIFAWKKIGPQPAVIAGAICIAMPQFYRAAHWILLDIGVGAFITAGLAVYGFMALRKPENDLLHALFFLCVAAAFLTKGIITLVYFGCIILSYQIYKRRLLPCRLNWTLLFFLVPVGIWLWFFYQEGGIYYLHEHFINNTIGRFLHKNIHLPGSPITIFDVGNSSPWSFYLERSPNMFGAALVLIPPALGEIYRIFRLPFPVIRKPKLLLTVWDALTAPRREIAPEERDLLVYLLCWALVPIILLSVPALKEVTFVLPSYAGIALLCAWYLDDRLDLSSLNDREIRRGLFLPCIVFALAAQLLAPWSATGFLILASVMFGILAVGVICCIRRKNPHCILLLILSGLIGAVILGNTPEIMRKTRLNRKCYDSFAASVWETIGERKLFIFGCDESIRGSMPFYGDRTVTMLPDESDLLKHMEQTDIQAVMMTEGSFNSLSRKNDFAQRLRGCRIVRPDFPQKAGTFVLLMQNDTSASAR